MIDQPTLPFSGITNATAERSRRAGEQFAPHLGKRQREVLELFAAAGDRGLTDNGLIGLITARGGSPNGPRARRIELFRAGFLEPTGEERDGCTVWRITAEGRDALR